MSEWGDTGEDGEKKGREQSDAILFPLKILKKLSAVFSCRPLLFWRGHGQGVEVEGSWSGEGVIVIMMHCLNEEPIFNLKSSPKSKKKIMKNCRGANS